MSEQQKNNNVVELRLSIQLHVEGAEITGIQANENANNQMATDVQQADPDYKQEALDTNHCEDVTNTPTLVNDPPTQPEEVAFLTILRDAEANLRLCIEQIQAVANAAGYIEARDCVEGLMEEFVENGQLANFRNLIQEVQRVNTGAGIGETGCDRQAILDALKELHHELFHIIEVEEEKEKERKLDQMAHQVINDPDFQENLLAMVKATLKAAEK